MAVKTRWIQDENGKKHPATNILFAYTRRQQIAGRLEIRRHINECPSCLHKCGEIERVSAVLGTLEDLQSHLNYADVQSALLLSSIQERATRYDHNLSTYVMRYVESIIRAILRFIRILKPKKPIYFVGVHIMLILILLTALLALGIALALQRTGVPFYPG
jgi:hypothetical protein